MLILLSILEKDFLCNVIGFSGIRKTPINTKVYRSDQKREYFFNCFL